MRKFTILMALVAFASFAMAQVQIVPEFNSKVTKSSAIEKTNRTQVKAEAAWSCDFEESTPIWTTSVTPVEMDSWVIVDQNSYNPLFGDFVDGWYFFPLGEYSLTGNAEGGVADGHWACLDVISYALPGGDLVEPPVIGESSIRFDNINLATISSPKIQWYQMFRPFNPNWFDCFIDVSINGGTTWTNYPVNVDIPHGENAPVFSDIAIPIAGGESNVSVQFRWTMDRTNTSGNATVGYGWQIDDISIVTNPDYDMALVDARMSFFDYADYNLPNQDHLFHYSSHFGHVPLAQIESTNANMWFDWIVENRGNMSGTPTVKVTVTNPIGEVAYTHEVIGNLMTPGAIDTLDIMDTGFQLTAAYIGNYVVSYEVFMTDNTDENPDNNLFGTEFNVTSDLYARDIDNITSSFAMSGYTIGGVDTEVIATEYFFVEDTEILSGDVFIGANTDLGTAFQLQLFTYNSTTDLWEVFTESTIYNIEEGNPGTWMHCTWNDPANLVVDPEAMATGVRAGVKIYYNGEENDFYVGADKSIFYGDFASFCYINNAGEWGWYYGFTEKGLAIRLNVPYVTEVENINNNNIVSVYPNPTYGTLNIENVEGAQVQIINLMGQVVENITNAQMVNTVDMSKFANGTYFVKVINGNETSTHKVNLMK